MNWDENPSPSFTISVYSGREESPMMIGACRLYVSSYGNFLPSARAKSCSSKTKSPGLACGCQSLKILMRKLEIKVIETLPKHVFTKVSHIRRK